MSWLDWLRINEPRTGRLVLESGDVWNVADASLLRDLADPMAAVIRGDAYVARHARTLISAATDHHYLINCHPTKYTVWRGPRLSVGAGPVTCEQIPAATATGGTALPVDNLRGDGPAPGASVWEGVTPAGGALPRVLNYLFGAGQSDPTPVATVYPPGAQIVLRVRNLGLAVNPGAWLELSFAEVALVPLA